MRLQVLEKKRMFVDSGAKEASIKSPADTRSWCTLPLRVS